LTHLSPLLSHTNLTDVFSCSEKKLAKQLGYDTIEELEAAIDEMEGIGEDGVAIDDDEF